MFFKKFFTGSIFLIKKVVGDIYISNINNLILKKKNIYSDFIFFLIFSTILSFSIYLFIIYFSEDLFQLYIDKKWFISQEILKIYSALICFSFVPSLLNRILNNYYQKIDFMWSLIFVFSILIFIIYYNYNTYIDFFETLVKFEILIYALYLLITFTVIYKIQKKIEFNKLD